MEVDIAAVFYTAVCALEMVSHDERWRKPSTFVVVRCSQVPLVVATLHVTTSKNNNVRHSQKYVCFFKHVTLFHKWLCTYHIGDKRWLRRACDPCSLAPEHSLFVHMKNVSRRRFRPKFRHLAPLYGCACAFEEWVYGGRERTIIAWHGSNVYFCFQVSFRRKCFDLK